MSTRFDPIVNGWSFDNFNGNNASWDLYRETYLGINPTQNCAEAPLDCAFYEEAFKICADKGNCGGISLLGLALFKYGGYMGFCSPASLYNGDASGPSRADLRRAINILQARQFSVGGIENFLDVVDASNLNNAVAAYAKIEEGLGSGDYAILSIANSLLGEVAHTVIPYSCYKSGGTRYLDIWDSNFPADEHPGHYGSANARMVIHGPTDWEYFPNPSDLDPSPYPYRGSNNGWCFAIPMSRILSKDRQPFTLDLLFDALLTAFLSGPGASISQISDEEGHTLYKTEASVHLHRSELETDPDKRLKGVMRWPWYGQVNGESQPGELYFIRGAASRSPLTFTVSGTEYKLTHFKGRNMTVLEGNSAKRTKDVIRITPAPHDLHRMVEVRSGGKREFNVRTLRMDDERGAWKSVELKNVKLTNSALRMQVIGALDDVHVDGIRKKVEFNVKVQERKRSKISSKQYKNVSADAKEPFRLALKKRRK